MAGMGSPGTPGDGSSSPVGTTGGGGGGEVRGEIPPTVGAAVRAEGEPLKGLDGGVGTEQAQVKATGGIGTVFRQ